MSPAIAAPGWRPAFVDYLYMPMGSTVQLEDREGIERRSGSAGDAQRGGHEKELPASHAGAAAGQLLEIQVVKQVDTHRVDRKYVDGESDPFGAARRGVAVCVRAQRRNLPIRQEGRG